MLFYCSANDIYPKGLQIFFFGGGGGGVRN